jgi:hypothetical protein
MRSILDTILAQVCDLRKPQSTLLGKTHIRCVMGRLSTHNEGAHRLNSAFLFMHTAIILVQQPLASPTTFFVVLGLKHPYETKGMQSSLITLHVLVLSRNCGIDTGIQCLPLCSETNEASENAEWQDREIECAQGGGCI